MKRITDMATELVTEVHSHGDGLSFDIDTRNGVKHTTTTIRTARAAKSIGKPIGTYHNFELKSMDFDPDTVSAELAKHLSSLICSPARLLIVGLGNNRFVADSLGPKTCELIKTGDTLMTFAPSVSGITGIPSTDAIAAITKKVQPTHVLVVDSLCCHEQKRLGASFQLTNTGIQPGSGITRNNQKLDEQFLGCPVIAIGVPMVISLPGATYVVPKTIDAVVARCACAIADAVNALGQ